MATANPETGGNQTSEASVDNAAAVTANAETGQQNIVDTTETGDKKDADAEAIANARVGKADGASEDVGEDVDGDVVGGTAISGDVEKPTVGSDVHDGDDDVGDDDVVEEEVVCEQNAVTENTKPIG